MKLVVIASERSLALSDLVILPNHLHGSLWLKDIDGKGEAFAVVPRREEGPRWANDSPQQKTPPTRTQPGSLGAILQNFKRSLALSTA